MSVISISRDTQNNVSIVRMITTDALATVVTANYILNQMPNIRALNGGFWQWYKTDIIAVACSDQNAFLIFTDSTFDSVVAYGDQGSGIITPGLANELAFYAANGSTVSGLPTADNGLLVTNASGVPSISSTLPTGFVVALANGGTSASLVANDGGIFYSTATAGAILAGSATADQVLMSGLSSAPDWSNATYPSSTSAGQLIYSAAADQITGLNPIDSGALVTSATGLPTWLGPLTNGQIVIGSTGAIPVATTLTAGTGISIGNAAGAITITSTVSGSLTWNLVQSTSVALVANNGYVINDFALVHCSLPTTGCPFGALISICGFSTSSVAWVISQGAGQQIIMGAQSSTVGTGGSVLAPGPFDQIDLLCVVANTTFVVRNAVTQGFTFT